MPCGRKTERKTDNIFQNLDRWENMKRGRMTCLLEQIEVVNEIDLDRFLGQTAVKYGIREATGREYIRDWVNAECIAIENNKIKFLKKLD